MVSRWAIHRRLYDWVLSFAHSRHSTTALFLLSFAESSFFPVPPDVLLAPLCLGNRRKAMWFAAVCTGASVLGGVGGFLIGMAAWEGLDALVYRYVPGFSEEQFHQVVTWYGEWGVWIVFTAAFTPIPYKVFTIAAGVFGMNLPLFIATSLVGRGARFFFVAGLMWKFGERIVPFIDRYFNLLCIAFTALLVGGFAAVKVLS
jgi:membrane protein YqaA with SNARE-associated domain